jgi:lambda repressor-like predicted transcriptional regulator
MFVKQQRLNLDKLFRFCDAASQRELSETCGVSHDTVYHWIRNGGVPEPQADRIAIRLGVHPSAIWGDEWFALAYELAV